MSTSAIDTTTHQINVARGHVGCLIRMRADPGAIEAARAELRMLTAERRIAELVAPLTAQQRTRLAELMLSRFA